LGDKPSTCSQLPLCLRSSSGSAPPKQGYIVRGYRGPPKCTRSTLQVSRGRSCPSRCIALARRLNVFLLSDENELPAIYVIRFKQNTIPGRRMRTARAEGKETLADVAAVYARVSLREAQQLLLALCHCSAVNCCGHQPYEVPLPFLTISQPTPLYLVSSKVSQFLEGAVCHGTSAYVLVDVVVCPIRFGSC